MKQGHIQRGLRDAWQILESARLQQRYILARDVAELIVEYGAQSIGRTGEAQRVLDELNERFRIADEDIPDLGPLPGLPEWDGRVTRLLLREKGELDAAVVLAAEVGLPPAVLELLRLGASPRAVSKERRSVLVIAVTGGHQQVVETLLKARSDPFDLEDEHDRSAAEAAIVVGKDGVLKQLLDACPVKKPYLLGALLAKASAGVGSSETVRILCDAGADPDELWDDRHPLVRAAEAGNLCALEALAERIGDIHRVTDADGETPLMAATGAGHEPVIIWLVDHGADVIDFDVKRLRFADAPWLGGQLALLPHIEGKVEVPLFVNDQSITLAGRTNEWIYEAMSSVPPPHLNADLLTYVRFFFTTVVGRLGGFRIADRVEDAIWLPDASEDKRREFEDKLSQLRMIGISDDGRLEVRGTVVFKNALFMISVMVGPNWELELANEDLLMEDLPIEFGAKIDLLVRR
jgi:hypothetical protein